MTITRTMQAETEIGGSPRQHSGQQQHVEQGQRHQSSLEEGQNISRDHFASNHQHQEQGHQGNQQQQPDYLDPLRCQIQSQAIAPFPSPDGLSDGIIHGGHNELDKLNRLARSSAVLEPYNVQGPPQPTPMSVPPGEITEPLYGIPSGGSASYQSAPQFINHDKQNGSFGTLMLTRGGRSKYLGPTAGSEWLKEVCQVV